MEAVFEAPRILYRVRQVVVLLLGSSFCSSGFGRPLSLHLPGLLALNQALPHWVWVEED